MACAESVARSTKALNHKGTRITNVHDDGSSPSVMKALTTETRRHRGKAFFSSPCLCASVVIFFHGKRKALLCALCGFLLFRAFCDNLLREIDDQQYELFLTMAI